MCQTSGAKRSHETSLESSSKKRRTLSTRLEELREAREDYSREENEYRELLRSIRVTVDQAEVDIATHRAAFRRLGVLKRERGQISIGLEQRMTVSLEGDEAKEKEREDSVLFQQLQQKDKEIIEQEQAVHVGLAKVVALRDPIRKIRARLNAKSVSVGAFRYKLQNAKASHRSMLSQIYSLSMQIGLKAEVGKNEPV